MIPSEILSAMRGRFAFHRLSGLEAATANYDEAGKHIRIDFFFAGTSEEVDFEELEAGTLGELITDAWAGVNTIGFAVYFDAPSAEKARLDPSRLYPA
ncbi:MULTISPECIES: hypothetical protein [unclassified Sphingopyxis]|uniref:hypothetical protein n=1 Tax=unclassified Sphingopyxis TaxID=2614943 RepID=UPI00285ACE1D|nr:MULTISPECIES: hypothetical protein [unclassified Sphingopyxis]MDR7061700.1 hypothetical protein [Sphingopyxis sp. BE235]MDR7182355.1 hypothetical protein [Sphingopyxis sp. BE249]